MTSIPITHRVSAADRLGLTLFIAIALHLLIILGIGFDSELFKPRDMPLSLEIILVHSQSEEAPDEADYLAQVSQRGGGDVEEARRPSSPESSLRPTQELGDAPEDRPLSAPPPRPVDPQRTVMSTELQARSQIAQRESPIEQVTIPAPTTAELMDSARQIAQLAASIQQRQETLAKRDRERSIAANTRESVYAAYQDAWRQKVERIGNLNYPDEARRRGLSGALLLKVSIRADGSLLNVEVLRSSGHRELDDGAIRIVRMAAPYAPFPAEMRKETDILHINRVWQFETGHQLSTY